MTILTTCGGANIGMAIKSWAVICTNRLIEGWEQEYLQMEKEYPSLREKIAKKITSHHHGRRFLRLSLLMVSRISLGFVHHLDDFTSIQRGDPLQTYVIDLREVSVIILVKKHQDAVDVVKFVNTSGILDFSCRVVLQIEFLRTRNVASIRKINVFSIDPDFDVGRCCGVRATDDLERFNNDLVGEGDKDDKITVIFVAFENVCVIQTLIPGLSVKERTRKG